MQIQNEEIFPPVRLDFLAAKHPLKSILISVMNNAIFHILTAQVEKISK